MPDETRNLDSTLEKAEAIVQTLAELASGMVGKVGGLAILGAASAAWLGFFIFRQFDTAWYWAGLVSIVAALPCVPLAILYSVLDEATVLPKKLVESSANLRSRVQAARPAGAGAALGSGHDQQSGLRSLWRLSGLVTELGGMALDVYGSVALFGGLSMLANPLFLMSLAIGSVGVICTAGLALVSLIAFVLL